MYDKDLATKVDLTSVDDVEEMVRSISQMICAEQPDMPEPQSLRDMDSFSVVQVLLEIENTTERKLLEKIENFIDGEEFRDLAEFIVKILAEEDEEPQQDGGEQNGAVAPKAETVTVTEADAAEGTKNGAVAPKAEAAPQAEAAPEDGSASA